MSIYEALESRIAEFPWSLRGGRVGLVALGLGATLVACAPGGEPLSDASSLREDPREHTGKALQGGVGQGIDTSRIVSLGGAVTESIHALGLGSQIVAVDTSSLFPEGVQALPKVGYVRSASAEGILSFEPTLVVASDDLGPPGLAGQLSEGGLPLLTLTADRSIEGAKARLSTLGEALGRVEEAEAVTRMMDSDLAKAAQGRREGREPPKVLFVYARGAGHLMVAGSGTGPDEMIALAGGINAARDIEGFKPLSSEAVLAAAPDVVLMTTRGSASLGGEAEVFEVIGLPPGSLEAPPRLLTLDDNLLLSFGPRAGKGALALQGLLFDGGPQPQ